MILCYCLQLREEFRSSTHIFLLQRGPSKGWQTGDTIQMSSSFCLSREVSAPRTLCAILVLEPPERPVEGRENPEEVCKMNWRQRHKERGE